MYEQEKQRREAAEQKYEELVNRVRPLLESVDRMSEPAHKIEEAMKEYAKLQKTESVGDGHEV